MSLRQVGSIQLSDDPPFSRASWKFERAGWIGLTAFLLAGFAGVLGPGLFSGSTARDGTGAVQIRYDRSGHFRSDGTLEARVRPGGGVASLWIDDQYLENVEIQSVRPEPSGTRTEAGGSTYLFGAGKDPVEVRFEVSYKKAGVLRGRFGGSPGGAVEIRQFIYP